MRVRCINEELTEEEVKATGLPPGRWDLTVGKEYLVLGITIPLGNPAHPRGVGLEIERDGGTVLTIPLALFEITDDRVSRFWKARVLETPVGRCLCLWPEEFYATYFFDDLSEGFPEVVRTYLAVRERLEREFEEPEEDEY